MCRKHKEVYKVLNYIEYLLILVFATTGYALIFSFASLVPTVSSAKGLKICLITAGVKKYKSMSKKRRKHNKVSSLSKDKLNTIEFIISNNLTDWYIKHNQFVSVNNVLEEYEVLKEAIKIMWLLNQTMNMLHIFKLVDETKN